MPSEVLSVWPSAALPLTDGASAFTGGSSVGSVVVVVAPEPDPPVLATMALGVPRTVAERGQLDQVGPPVGHVALSEVADICEEFSLVHGPFERSLKYRAPPRPSSATQYVPDFSRGRGHGDPVPRAGLGEASVPEVSSEPGRRCCLE